MSHIIGRGRYRGETYPSTGSSSGSPSGIVPLSRQKFIDGDTGQTGLNGSVAEPFKTIAEFMASRGDASTDDAASNYVGWVMPTLVGYVEDVAFPPYVSTELRAASFSLTRGTTITGNVTWANVAGVNPADDAVVTTQNLRISGSFTVTDDAGAPDSFVFIDADGGVAEGGSLGSFDSNGATHLVDALFSNVSVGEIDAGTSSSSAAVGVFDCVVSGDILARVLAASDSTINSSAITVEATSPATFIGCTFTASTVLDCQLGAHFDGRSWTSFVENGGTRAATGTGTPVLVFGGYSGAGVEGAALTGASTSVSLDGTGATAGWTGQNSGNHYSTSNGTPTTVTLKTGGGELPGDTILITKTDLGANVLAVKNNAAATIGTIPTNSRGFVLARFDGSDWVFEEGGSLLA